MIILDSNIWIAGYNQDDALHEEAVKQYLSLENEVVYVPEYVWIEVSTVLEQKAKNNFGRDFLDIIEFGENIQMLYFSQEETKEFVEYYRAGAPKGLSFIDASLLLLSKKYTILTFDKKLKNAISEVKWYPQQDSNLRPLP